MYKFNFVILPFILSLFNPSVMAETYLAPDARFNTYSNAGDPSFLFLKVDLTASNANAMLQVVSTCTGRLHNHGSADALNNIVFFTDTGMTPAQYGAYCIPISNGWGAAATVTFSFQECGDTKTPPTSFVSVAQTASSPTTIPYSTMFSSSGSLINGCIARISIPTSPTHPTVNYEYGGLAIEFNDGFFIGKQYMAGQFMSLADGYSSSSSSFFSSSILDVMSHQVYRYKVDITSPIYYAN